MWVGMFRECPDEAFSEIHSQNQLIQGHHQAINNPAPHLQDNRPIDLDQELDAVIQILNNDIVFKSIANETTDLESALTKQIANNAVEELKKLCTTDEPFWLKDVNEGKFIFQHDSYQRILDKRYCLTGPNARVECSRDSRLVNMNVEQLVDMFLDTVSSSNTILNILSNFCAGFTIRFHVLTTYIFSNPSRANGLICFRQLLRKHKHSAVCQEIEMEL